MKKKIRTIWSYDIGDLENWRDAWEDGDELDDDELRERAERLKDDYLWDERVNLNHELSTDIICIADLGLWYGRCSGYKIIGSNIKDCLYSECDYNEWYIDSNGDLRCTASHHDGTNYYVYRAFKENLSAERRDNFLNKLLSGDFTQKDLSTYTKRIGPAIAEIYGFKCPGTKIA